MGEGRRALALSARRDWARATIGVAITLCAVAASMAAAGCGGESQTPAPTGPLAEALAATGGGGAHGSLGIGWADPRRVARAGLGAQVVATALGPNAGSVIEAGRRIERRFGFDPMRAERLVSVGGSYAFGLRLDGVDGRRLGRALVRAGGRSRQAAHLRLVAIGAYAVVPPPLLDLGVRGLGAYDALGPDRVVLAISDRARSALLGRGGRLFDEPIYAAAARCLGNVVAARMIPDKLLISSELGIGLVAVGLTARSEVLCAVGGTPGRSGEIASSLERSLAPGARDPVSGEPVGKAFKRVTVARRDYHGVPFVRAEGAAASRRPQGYFFGTLSSASVVSLINGTDRLLR